MHRLFAGRWRILTLTLKSYKQTAPLSLAGIKVQDTRMWRNASTGDPMPMSAIYVDETDPGYPSKVVRKIKTPKVLELARQQFGCPSLTGVPVEDRKGVNT